MIDKEKVRELAAKLFIECGLHIPKGESVITEWLEQNQPETIVVGLSDEQVEGFAQCFATYSLDEIIPATYKEWVKTQTFAQQSAVTLNWDDAPVGATTLQLNLAWLNKNGDFISGENIEEFECPKPTQQVEVKQVWRDKKEFDELTIIALGKNKIYDTICYQFTESRVIEIRCYDDFLAKFERVGGSE